MNSKSGFTLVELLLVIVLISVITVFSVPVFSTLLTSSELNDASDKVVHTLRRAQLLSETMRENTTWGIFVESGQVTVFAGSDYASRNVVFDEIYDFGEEIIVTGDDEYVFSLFEGLPDSSGTITLANNFGSQNVNISSEGVLSF